jgi:hypothetical protein
MSLAPEFVPEVIGPCAICTVVIVESTVEPVDENDLSQAVVYDGDKQYHATCWYAAKGKGKRHP